MSFIRVKYYFVFFASKFTKTISLCDLLPTNDRLLYLFAHYSLS